MGKAGVGGAPVGAFQEEDATHLVSLKRTWDDGSDNEIVRNSSALPSWLAPPAASRKSVKLIPAVKSDDNFAEEDRKACKANICGGKLPQCLPFFTPV